MSHYAKARQVDPEGGTPDAGRYRYTTSSRHGGTYAIGYCSPLDACPNVRCLVGQTWDPVTDVTATCTDCDGKGYIRRTDPCPGHLTATEACAHYREYLLAERLRFDVVCAGDVQHKCEVCGTWTQVGADIIDHHNWWLCPKHQTREVVDRLFGAVGATWSN